MTRTLPLMFMLTMLTSGAALLALLAGFATASPAFSQGRTTFAAPTVEQASANLENLNERITELLRQVVTEDGLVHYEKLRGPHRESLKALVQAVAQPRQFESDRDRLAFYINAYNLLVLEQVLANWPVTKVTDVPGFFDKTKHTVAGRELTLNQLEHDVIRSFNDPRIHAALVCAAVSCPPLLAEAFKGQRIDDQLDASSKRWVNDPNKNTARDGAIYASKIFEWYGQDFNAGPYGSIRGFLRHFAEEDSALGKLLAAEPDAPLKHLEYDWRLNDPKR